MKIYSSIHSVAFTMINGICLWDLVGLWAQQGSIEYSLKRWFTDSDRLASTLKRIQTDNREINEKKLISVTYVS